MAVPLAASILPAVTALTGVLLGAAVNMFGQWVFARRQEGAERQSAARLLSADLLRARTILQDWVDDPPEAIPGWASELSLPAWERGQASLATRLDRREWETVLLACNAVDSLRRLLVTGTSLTSDLADVRAAREKVDAARAVLDGRFEP